MSDAQDEAHGGTATRVRVLLALIGIAIAVLFYWLSSFLAWLGPVGKPVAVGVVALVLLRLVLELVAEVVGEGSFEALSERRRWVRPVAIALYFVGMIGYVVWDSLRL